MRKRGIPIALLVASAYPFATHAATTSEWQGSYAANGQCFCSGDVASSIASKIVPTPIGGQTVKQVCAMVGNGPGLRIENDLYNHPVFKDPQCGNGPFANDGGPRDVNCVGSLDGTYSSCQPAGPRWALAQAYGTLTPGAPAAALPEGEIAKSLAEELVEKASATVASITETAKTSERINNSVAASESSEDSLTGESVMLEGIRYYRARVGLPAEGGAPGSRIVLDGLVYLKDDGNLAQADLYSGEEEPEKPVAVTDEPELVVVEIVAPKPKPVEAAPVKKPKPVRKPAPKLDPKRIARLKREREEREAKTRARLQFEKNMREARQDEEKKRAEQIKATEQARLVEQKKLAEQQRQTVEGQRDLRAKFAVPSDQDDSTGVSTQVGESSDENTSKSANEAFSTAALQLPPDTRASAREFDYMEAMPINYDFGGGGVMLEGSGQVRNRYQFLGRIGVSDTYNEFMLGGGYYVTPPKATRLTLVLLAGIEHGSFELRDETIAPDLVVTASDSGVFLSAMTRIVVSSRFELKAGVGYSSFFEGDPILFGGGYYHLTPRLDIMSRFELGDNDNLGIGIRYYY